MPFAVADFHDLTRLLEERPEWRAELRRLVLTDGLLALPEQIAESRLDTDRRFQEVSAQIARLTEAQEQFATELAELRADTDRRFQEVSAQIARLTETQERLISEFDALTRTVLGLVDDVGKLKGSDLERRFRERAFAYFGRLIRRAHVLTQEELADQLDGGLARGAITEREADELTWADLIVRGKRRDDATEVSLVVEVSYGVGVGDVERVERRAELYGRLVAPVLPVVAGEAVTAEAAQCARSEGVWQLVRGGVVPPDTAPSARTPAP